MRSDRIVMTRTKENTMHTVIDLMGDEDEVYPFETVDELGEILANLFQKKCNFYSKVDDQYSRDLVEIYRNYDFKDAKIRGRALEDMLGIKIS